MLKQRFLILCILGYLLAYANPCLAECKPNAETLIDLKACSIESYKRADTKHNQTYKDLMNILDSKYRDYKDTSYHKQAKQRLIEAEKAWMDYRDKNCAYINSRYEGGREYPIYQKSCYTRMTEARTQELLQQISEENQHPIK